MGRSWFPPLVVSTAYGNGFVTRRNEIVEGKFKTKFVGDEDGFRMSDFSDAGFGSRMYDYNVRIMPFRVTSRQEYSPHSSAQMSTGESHEGLN